MIGGTAICIVGAMFTACCLALAFAAILAWRAYSPSSPEGVGALAAFLAAIGSGWWLAHATLHAVGAL